MGRVGGRGAGVAASDWEYEEDRDDEDWGNLARLGRRISLSMVGAESESESESESERDSESGYGGRGGLIRGNSDVEGGSDGPYPNHANSSSRGTSSRAVAAARVPELTGETETETMTGTETGTGSGSTMGSLVTSAASRGVPTPGNKSDKPAKFGGDPGGDTDATGSRAPIGAARKSVASRDSAITLPRQNPCIVHTIPLSSSSADSAGRTHGTERERTAFSTRGVDGESAHGDPGTRMVTRTGMVTRAGRMAASPLPLPSAWPFVPSSLLDHARCFPDWPLLRSRCRGRLVGRRGDGLVVEAETNLLER